MAVFKYTSRCCQAPTKKDPCVRSKDDLIAGKFSDAGLGKWKCLNCRRHCAVTRSKDFTTLERAFKQT